MNKILIDLFYIIKMPFQIYSHKIALIAIPLLLSSCSFHNSYHSQKINAYDPKLQSEFYEKEDLSPPYIALFNKGGKQLIYIATKHETKQDSLSFQIIKEAFVKYKPDFLIIEGVASKYGTSSQGLIAHINICMRGKTCGENLYAAYLASKDDIKFIGAEPSDEEIYNVIKLKNYSREDFLFFYFVRQVAQYDREGKSHSLNDLPKLFVNFMSLWQAQDFSYEDFINWYEEKTGKKIIYKDLIDSELCAPIENGTYLQKLSSESGMIREKNIISTILNYFEKNNKILVVYGASHFFMAKNVLIKYLGKPEYIN